MKPGSIAGWARRRLERLRATELYRRYLRPAVSVLRWEGIILLGALGFAIVSALVTRWFILFVFLAAVLLGLAWGRAFDESEKGQRFRRRAERAGLWVWALLLALVGVAIFWRFSTRLGSVIFALAYALVGVTHLVWLGWRTTPMARQFKQVVALSVTPVLGAWILNSTVYTGYTRVLGILGSISDDGRGHQERRRERARRAVAWESDGARPVAVALSGGGYRAAVVHAGLLWALDEAGVPIHYLSTVSGGSIVGATYALGWSPAEFRDHLKRSRPGLPNDLANFYPIFKQLVIPSYGSGDTYAAHFDRVYFHGGVLDDTGPPVLILNATRYSDGRREAFWPGHAPTDRLARMVAASGAFPVAFDPVRIADESYVDGGVVDNLGIAGLQHYFRDVAGEPDIAQRIPGVLIISDVSVIPKAPRSWRKPSVPQMAMQAQKASYFAMHQWIYSFYTAGQYDRKGTTAVQQPYAVKAGLLWPDLGPSEQEREVQVFVLSPASPAERSHFEGHEALLEAVSSLQTLEELTGDEVEAAFWVGARLAEVYMPRICAAARAARCPQVDLPPPPPVPSSARRLLRSARQED